MGTVSSVSVPEHDHLTTDRDGRPAVRRVPPSRDMIDNSGSRALRIASITRRTHPCRRGTTFPSGRHTNWRRAGVGQ